MPLYLSNRMKEIIEKLYLAEKFVTSTFLAEELGVTSRTIRNDIEQINSKLKNMEVEISSKRGKGYRLIVSSKELLKDLLYKVKEEKVLFKANSVTSEDRVRFIIKKLLYSSEGIKLESLTNELFVSESTVKDDLKIVKKILNKYNIKVIKTNQGIQSKGNEVNKRFCISDYFIYKEEINNQFLIKLVNSFDNDFSEHDIEKINNVILSELNKYNFEVKDEILSKITTHIIIAIGRIMSGQDVNIISNINYLKNEDEYIIAEKINNTIESMYHITFSEEEVAYTTLHLVGNRLSQKNNTVLSNLKGFLGDRIFHLANTIVKQSEIEIKGMKIKEDDELIYGLGLHLKQLITRLQYKMNIRNPMVDEIKIKYPLAFELGVIAAHLVEKETKYLVNENEIGFLALHFGAALERQRFKSTPKMKVALVCASGMATSELLLTKLSYLLDEKYNLIGSYALHQLEKLMKQNPDYILTTVPIEEELNLPIISVPSILEDRDIYHIQSSIEKESNKENMVSQFFKNDLFYTDLKLKTKEKVLEYLTNEMIEKGYIDYDIKSSINERERIASTSIGNRVAIPHPLNMIAKHSFICTAILNSPIKWSEDEDVQLVMVIVLERKYQKRFQEIFGLLYEILHSKANVKIICKQKEINNFKKIIDTLE